MNSSRASHVNDERFLCRRSRLSQRNLQTNKPQSFTGRPVHNHWDLLFQTTQPLRDLPPFVLERRSNSREFLQTRTYPPLNQDLEDPGQWRKGAINQGRHSLVDSRKGGLNALAHAAFDGSSHEFAHEGFPIASLICSPRESNKPMELVEILNNLLVFSACL